MDKRFQQGLAVLFALVVIIGAVAFFPIDDYLRNTTDDEQVDSDDDGLRDVFERTVAGTDPNDPDSDSAKTKRDEEDNGVNDSAERLGDTKLSLSIQQQIGADPFSNDTDGDGLTDLFEIVDLGLIHNIVNGTDADGDGVPDGKEDLDNDTLTNHREQELDTDPLDKDTDNDGLTDNYEIEHDLDPLEADGDTDGLDDGSERRAGTDPDEADTDGDGTTDGYDVQTVSITHEPTNVSLSITGEGDPVDSLSITTNASVTFDNISATVSPVVELDTNRSFSHATVRIPYNESRVPTANESKLAIYTFNESRQTFLKLDSTVNTNNNTVTARTTHFSTFVVFDVSNWNAKFDTPLPDRGAGSGNESKEFVDAQFVIDSSPSMNDNDPYGFRKTAAIRFVNTLIKGDRASVITFGGHANTEQNFTTDFTAVKTTIDQSTTIISTDIGNGLREGIDGYERASHDSRAKIIVLLTDGKNNLGMDGVTLQQARRAADQNITIHTIGFGNSDNALLRKIAGITGGEFHHVKNVTDLPKVFGHLANNTTKGTDSDGDGIPDTVETGGIRSGTGEVYHTAPNNPDTDGDGVSDGVEVGGRIRDRYYTIHSNPEVTDSDSDNLSDLKEYEIGTNLFNEDTDHDDILDGEDPRPLITYVPHDPPDLPDKPISIPDEPDRNHDRGRALVLGAIFGESGLEGGWADGIVGELASSPYYVVGWLGFSFVPAVGGLSDLRDAAQAVADGESLNAALSAAGLVPVIGDTAKGVKSLEKWTSVYGSQKVDELAPVLAKHVLNSDKIFESVKVEVLDELYNFPSILNRRYGVQADALVTLTEARIDLNWVGNLLDRDYSTWTRGRYSQEPRRTKNFERHYRDHANDFGTDSEGNPLVTKKQYRRKAQQLMNKRQNVRLYYDTRHQTLVVYDPKTNELAAGTYWPQTGISEIRTLFKPDRGPDHFDPQRYIRLNEA